MADNERSWRVRAALRDEPSGFFFIVKATTARDVVEIVEEEMKTQDVFILSVELMPAHYPVQQGASVAGRRRTSY